MPTRRNSILLSVLIGIHLWFVPNASAAWFDAAWPYRRAIDVTWDADRGNGDDLAMVEFYTAGHAQPNGSDVRVATDDGKLVASRVLQYGPGDRARVAFQLAKSQKKYFVYFGNDSLKPPQKEADDLRPRRGMLLEMKKFTGGSVENFKQIENAWTRGGERIGATMIDRPFIGINPLSEDQRSVTKLTGSIFAPFDGEYQIAAVADDRAAIYIDGQPLLFVVLGPADTRYNKTVKLTRGPHEMTIYHVDFGGETILSVAWKKPGDKEFEIIPRDSFGVVYGGVIGPLQQHNKHLVADFKADYGGECYAAGAYTNRVRFTASAGKTGVPAKFEWDFGDGQTSTSAEVDHVYLFEGVYDVKLKAIAAGNSDTQTTKLSVTRKFDRIADPPTDPIQLHARIIESYDVATLPMQWLPRAAQVMRITERFDAMTKITDRIATETSHPDVGAALAAMIDVSRTLADKNREQDAAAMWERVPRGSDLQPRAARFQAEDLLWRTGDFDRAVAVLEPFAGRSSEESYRRLYGQSLVLAGRADEGAKLLRGLPMRDNADRRVAVSGALARSIEFYIDEKDADGGEETWAKWQSQYPADFLEGYGVLLRTKLMELRGSQLAAAKVAAAFAAAVPDSPYAPQLLDRAAKLWEGFDAQKSSAIRATLKQKYPEDPLSQ